MKNLYNLLLIIISTILYLVTIALWIAIPDELTLNVAITFATLAFTVMVLFMNRHTLKTYYLSQHFKKIQETIIFFFLVFSIFGLANYWAFKHPKQLDLSVVKINSLSDQSKKILKGLDSDITFKMFARKNEILSWNALLEFYRIEKNSIKIEDYDIDLRPDLVSEYGIQNTATLVIEYQGKRQYVFNRDELNITNALIKISRKDDPIVYYITGHREGDIESAANEGMNLIFKAAENSAVDIRPLSLLSVSEIPADAKAVILWGPKSALQKSELDVLAKYLGNKGNLLVAIDPDLNGDLHVSLRELVGQYKILIRNDIVIDKKSFVNGSNGSIPLVTHYEEGHVITNNFKGETFFPLTSSLEAIPDDIIGHIEGVAANIIHSSEFPDSWAESSLSQIVSGKVSFDQDKDKKGPMNLMSTFEGTNNRIAAFGNSTFVINAYAKYGSNYTLFLNSLSWVLGEDRLVSFDLPIIQSEPVFISAPQLGIIFYFSVIFSPLVLFAVAVFMYRRKRNK